MTTFSIKAGATLRITYPLPEPVPIDSIITASMGRGSFKVDFEIRPLTPEGISEAVISEVELTISPPVMATCPIARLSGDIRVASADGVEVYYLETFSVVIDEPPSGRGPVA